jgi:PAS domain S-box-containing protein
MFKKALVVDNDFFFVEFLTDLLESRGYEVVKAYDGKEGISRLNEGPVDILFVDMVMPKVDGKRFIEFTRKKYPSARFPIVTVSSTLVEQWDAVHESGADYFVAKGPIDTMAAVLQKLMDKFEKEGFGLPDDEKLLEPGKVYPRQATSELLDNLDYERAILESVGIGIIVVDKDARIISANPVALSVTGIMLEGVLNQHVTAIFSDRDHKARLVNELKKVIRQEEVSKAGFSAWLDAKEIRVIVSVLKVKGAIAGWVIALEDEIP